MLAQIVWIAQGKNNGQTESSQPTSTITTGLRHYGRGAGPNTGNAIQGLLILRPPSERLALHSIEFIAHSLPHPGYMEKFFTGVEGDAAL